MKSITLSIGPRGQITIPKIIRNKFKSNSVRIELVDETHAMLTPVVEVGGSLSEFKKDTDLNFEEIRNTSWIDSRKK